MGKVETVILLAVWVATPIMAWIWYDWKLALIIVALDTTQTRWVKDQFVRKG